MHKVTVAFAVMPSTAIFASVPTAATAGKAPSNAAAIANTKQILQNTGIEYGLVFLYIKIIFRFSIDSQHTAT